MRKGTVILLALCFLCGIASALTLQPTNDKKTRKTKAPSNERVNLLHADKLFFNQQINPTAKILVGSVRLEHAGTKLTCDSALFYETTNSFDAFGHVKMRQGDTLSLDCDMLYYSGNLEQARARKNVVLKHRQTTLYTDTLDYDKRNEIGYYQEGGRLLDEKNELQSDWGQYDFMTREAAFYYNVVLKNPRVKPTTILKTDSLYYNTSTGLARLVSLSNIFHGKDTIFTSNGRYDSKTDRAYLLDRSVVASGTRRIVGDSIDYNGKTKLAKAYGNVKSLDRINNQVMDCDSVIYNDKTKQTTGYGEVTFHNKKNGTDIKCKRATSNSETKVTHGYGGVEYNDRPNQRKITCQEVESNDKTKVTIGTGNVVYTDKKNQRTLKCNKVQTNDNTKETTCYDNVDIVDEMKSRHMTSDRAYMNDKTKESAAFGKVYIEDNKEDRTIHCDSIYSNDSTKVTHAHGHIDYVDNKNKNKYTGGYAYYDDLKGYAEAADSALLVDFSQKDTLYAHADSFRIYTYNINTDSVYRTLHAYHHFRAYRADVQAVCDSLVYVTKDSCATMYYDPIVWQQQQQLLGEKIHIWVNDSTLDSCYVVNQALSVERIDSVHYNQIASKEMHSYFKDKALDYAVALSNVYVNYYPFDDDSLMIGMDHHETTELRMFMKNKKLDHIWGAGGQGVLYPMGQIPSEQLYLENFAWFDYIRPRDKNDVFEWRGKSEATKLKPVATHQAPRQRLQDIK